MPVLHRQSKNVYIFYINVWFLKIHTVKLCIICQAVLLLGSFWKAVLLAISDFLHVSTLIRAVLSLGSPEYKSQNYAFIHNFYSRRLFGRHKKSNYLEGIKFRSRASCKTKCKNVTIFYKNFLFSLDMRCVPYVSTPLQLSRHYVSGRRVRPIACWQLVTGIDVCH